MIEIVELRLECRVRAGRVEVSGSLVDARGDKTGVAVESVPLPATPEELERYLSDDPDVLGSRLSEALFRGDVRERFLEGRRWVMSGETGSDRRLLVRIRTRDESLWLHRLPWEEALEPDRRRPLGLAPEITLVRDIVRRAPGRGCSLPGNAPRLLVVVGAPEHGAALDVATEVAALRRLDELGWRVDVVDSGHLDEIRAHWAQAHADATPYDVLHFIGHGRLGRGEGEVKVRTGDDDRDAWVPGSLLWQQMGNHPSPPLVVLNACDTAGTSADSSLAPALAFLDNGLSSVVAMARPIPDSAAVAFATAFYPQLADTRDPARALHAARLKIQSRHPESRDWAIPVALGSWRPWHRQAPASRGGRWRALAATAVLAGLAAFSSLWWMPDDEPPETFGFAAVSDLRDEARRIKERLADREPVDLILDDERSWALQLLGCTRAAKAPGEVFCVLRVENLRDVDRPFSVYLDRSRLLSPDGAIHHVDFLLEPDGETTEGDGRASLDLAPGAPATLVLAVVGVARETTTLDLAIKYYDGSVTFPAVSLESLSSPP